MYNKCLMNKISNMPFVKLIYNPFVFLGCVFTLLCTDIKAQELTWAQSVPSLDYEIAIDTDIDSHGNLFVIGHTGNSFIQFEGVTYYTNGNGGDVFVIKYDSLGQLLWFKTTGGNDDIYYDEALDIHVDHDDNVYLLINAAGGNYTYNGSVLSGINSPGQYSGEGVVIKVDNDGSYLWHDDGSGASYFENVATDTNGNAYITGTFNYNIILGDSIHLENTTNGNTRDMFVAKYSADGDIQWAKNEGGTIHNSLVVGNNIAIDEPSNKVIVMGRFSEDIIFETDTISEPNYSEAAFMVAYDTDGTELWVKTIFNNYLSPYCQGLDISADGVIGVAGIDSYLDGGIVGFYNLDGTVQSEVIYDSTTNAGFYSIEFNEDNGYYISGRFSDSIVIGNTPNDTTLYSLSVNPNMNYNNGVVLKFDSTHALTWGKGILTTMQNKVTYKNNRVMYAGYFRYPFIYYYYGIDTIFNASSDGWADAFFGEITEPLCPATIQTDVHSSCDELEWIDGNTYTSSNYNARYTLTNSNGCDSVIQLNYTRYQPTSGVDVQTSCYKIFWIDGVIYTESNNTATHTITNVNGCDSVVTLDLTIGVEDVGTTVIDSTISANMGGLTYQWLNCNDGYTAISGATAQSYSPVNNGSYAVEITQNGCVDTSACKTISIINTPEYNSFAHVKVYPNPSQGMFNIDLDKEWESIHLAVTDLHGKLILQQELKHVSQAKINLKEQYSGLYLLTVQSKESKKVILLVKE